MTQALAGPGDPDVEQPALLLDGLGVSAIVIGSSPSEQPTRKTVSHSRPLAAWNEASVTPLTVGACWAEARSSSSRTSAGSRPRGRGRTGRRRAPRARTATPTARGPRRRSWRLAVQPAPSSTSRARSGSGTDRRRTGPPRASGRWRRAPPCGRRTARRPGRGRGCRARPARSRRTRSGRWCGTAPRSPTAGAPRDQRAMRVATVGRLVGVVVGDDELGRGPVGALRPQLDRARAPLAPGPRSTRLASPTTWGVER